MKKNKQARHTAVTEALQNFPLLKPRCQYFGTCGGCLLQQLAYSDQLCLKRRLVQKHFTAAGIAVAIPEIIPSPEEWYYRNRMDFPVGEKGEIGLKPFGKWREVLDLRACYLLSSVTPEILQLVRDWMNKWNLSGWNNKQYTGYVRYVVLREGKNTGERLIMIVTAAGEQSAAVWADLVARLKNYATGICHGVNARVTDISIPAEIRQLWGKEFLTEKINDWQYKIFPAAFFQTNSAGAAVLQTAVVAAVSGKKVLDLYCGLGFFSLPLAAVGRTVLGVEIDAAAIALAAENARANQQTIQFVAASVEDWLSQGGDAAVREFAPDTIIVDPPRAGLHPRVIDWLGRQTARELIYVSCNYEQFVREYVKLRSRWQLTTVTAIDMFPHTPHVELVLRFVPVV